MYANSTKKSTKPQQSMISQHSYNARIGSYFQVRYENPSTYSYFPVYPNDENYPYSAISKEDAIKTAQQYADDHKGLTVWVTKVIEEDIFSTFVEIPAEISAETAESPAEISAESPVESPVESPAEAKEEDEYLNNRCSALVGRTVTEVAKTKSKMVIIQGGPGTGKSYTASKLAKQIPGAVIVSADDEFIRPDGVYRFDGTRIKEVHRTCRKKTIDALKKGHVVIVDNCNAAPGFVKPYLSMTYSPKVIVELHPKTIKDALLYGSRSIHDVPTRSIKKCHYSVQRIKATKTKLHYISRE